MAYVPVRYYERNLLNAFLSSFAVFPDFDLSIVVLFDKFLLASATFLIHVIGIVECYLVQHVEWCIAKVMCYFCVIFCSLLLSLSF